MLIDVGGSPELIRRGQGERPHGTAGLSGEQRQQFQGVRWVEVVPHSRDARCVGSTRAFAGPRPGYKRGDKAFSNIAQL